MSQYGTAKLFTLRWNHSYDKPPTDGSATHGRRNVEFVDNVVHDLGNIKVSLADTFGVGAGTDYIITRKRNKWTLGIAKQNYSPDPIVAAINDDAAGLGRADLFIFYYTGYGVRLEQGENELLIANNKPGRFIRCNPIISALHSLPCDVLVILDCCNAVDPNQIRPSSGSTARQGDKKMVILGACLASDLTTADSTMTMTNRLQKVLRSWRKGLINALPVNELCDLINGGTAELRRGGTQYVQDAVYSDYTNAGDIILSRQGMQGAEVGMGRRNVNIGDD